MNLYPAIIESGKGKNPDRIALFGTPGLASFSSGISEGPIRALFKSDEGGARVLVVGNDTVYDLSSAGVATSLGTISAATDDPVSISFNGAQYLIISDGVGYLLTGTVLAAISDPDFPASVMGLFSDGYFVVLAKDSQDIYISGLYAGTDWNPLEFGAAEASPDNALAIEEDHGFLWIYGTEKTEIFHNSGNLDFPFERIQGAIMEEGIGAGSSVAKLNDSLFWVGGSERGHGVVRRSRGFQSERVSNHAVEQALQGYSTLSDAVSFSYQEEGHDFYQVNFPTADKTWVYDATDNFWHERGYWDSALSKHTASRVNSHIHAYGKHLVGDRSSANVYEQSLNIYTDNGDVIRRVRRTPHIADEHKRISFNFLTIDMEVGVGLAVTSTATGYDPQLLMRNSNDGGRTWGNERQGNIGKLGETGIRVKFNRLGQSRDRVIEIAVAEPVKIAFTDAYLDIEREAA